MNIIREVEKRVKHVLSNKQEQSAAHRWGHVQRVLRKAFDIARRYENVDLETLQLAALLHDIDQPYNRKGDHVKLSMKSAKEILENLNYPKEKVEKVIEIIKYHSLEELPPKDFPLSMEAKILFDADKLDCVTAMGIARVFTICGRSGMEPENAIGWYEKKIEVALKNLRTEEGKKEAERLLPYVREFLSKMKQDI